MSGFLPFNGMLDFYFMYVFVKHATFSHTYFWCLMLCFISFEKDKILANMDPTLTYDNFNKVDMVIEAVFEDLTIKHKVIEEVEKVGSGP